mmetsp:Transcript_62190/g.110871  ORF Transcript_62190/g.110871 Transcript_62190/m.110871 type:complete len:91 (-) Transcript_62190:205-477(-)
MQVGAGDFWELMINGQFHSDSAVFLCRVLGYNPANSAGLHDVEGGQSGILGPNGLKINHVWCLGHIFRFYLCPPPPWTNSPQKSFVTGQT